MRLEIVEGFTNTDSLKMTVSGIPLPTKLYVTRVKTSANRAALMHLWEILSREFLDSYEGGLFWPEKPDAEKIYI